MKRERVSLGDMATVRKSNASTRWVLPMLGTIVFIVSFLCLSSTSQLNHIEEDNPVTSALRYFQTSRRVGSSLSVTAAESNKEESETGSTPIYTVTYPVEKPIDNPQPVDGHSTFSACMLVMDDNHRLAEWLAYHYHILPLRYIILVNDRRSKTSPTFLLNRWRRQGVYIEEWEDSDFWRGDLKDIPDDADLQIKRDRHRARQKFFYRKCLIELRRANRTWVALHDSDEYLVYNHAGGDDFEAWETQMQARHQMKRKLMDPKKRQNIPVKRTRPKHTPPTTAEPGALIKYIRDEQSAGQAYYQSPCIGVPRLAFGAEESTREEREKLVPASNGNSSKLLFDPMQFDTLRYRKHAERNDFVKNALGKVIMDVSRIDISNSPYFMSLHRPIKSICAPPWHNDWDSGLRINHYLGSWESYSYRDDSRKGFERSLEQWEYKGTTNGEESDDVIRPWLSGFVRALGVDRARELLEGVGLPRGYRNYNDTAWRLRQDKLDKILSTDRTVANDNKMVAFDAWVRLKYGKVKGVNKTLAQE